MMYTREELIYQIENYTRLVPSEKQRHWRLRMIGEWQYADFPKDKEAIIRRWEKMRGFQEWPLTTRRP